MQVTGALVPTGLTTIDCGRIRITPTRLLIDEDVELQFTINELRLIRALVIARPEFVHKRDLAELYRPGMKATDAYKTAGLRSMIKRIRQKFRKYDPSVDVIQTLPTIGYRWCLQLEEL